MLFPLLRSSWLLGVSKLFVPAVQDDFYSGSLSGCKRVCSDRERAGKAQCARTTRFFSFTRAFVRLDDFNGASELYPINHPRDFSRPMRCGAPSLLYLIIHIVHSVIRAHILMSFDFSSFYTRERERNEDICFSIPREFNIQFFN